MAEEPKDYPCRFGKQQEAGFLLFESMLWSVRRGNANCSKDAVRPKPVFFVSMWHRHIHRTYVPHGIYFVTTYIRYWLAFFSDRPTAKICEANTWNTFRIQQCTVFAYVIMPDHLHMLFQPSSTTVSKVMRSVKTNASRDINRYLHVHNRGPGTSVMDGRLHVPAPKRCFVWQSSFYDHVIRDERDFRNHVEYIRYNPVKAGLAKRPEEYLYLFVDENKISRFLGW